MDLVCAMPTILADDDALGAPLLYHGRMSLPYLTRDFPGIGGTIKNRPEDFFVQEGNGFAVHVSAQIGQEQLEEIAELAAWNMS